MQNSGKNGLLWKVHVTPPEEFSTLIEATGEVCHFLSSHHFVNVSIKCLLQVNNDVLIMSPSLRKMYTIIIITTFNVIIQCDKGRVQYEKNRKIGLWLVAIPKIYFFI